MKLRWSLPQHVFLSSFIPIRETQTQKLHISQFQICQVMEEAKQTKRGNMMTTDRGMEELMRRNTELENQLRDFIEREEVLKTELERTRMRLHFVEEAEERLCFQMGELEAEAVAQAHVYRLHVTELSDQLAAALRLLRSTNLVVN